MNVLGNSAAVTNLDTGGGDDVINMQATTAAKVLNMTTGVGTNTVNAGSALNLVDGIKGAVYVTGNGADALNVTDTGGKIPKNTGILRDTSLTGLGMGKLGISFTGLAALNITLGAGNDTMTVVNTPTAATTLDMRAGNDLANVLGSTGPFTLPADARRLAFRFARKWSLLTPAPTPFDLPGGSVFRGESGR